MHRTLVLILTFAAVLPAAKVTGFSTDMVMLQGGQVTETLKLCASGQKSRIEGFTAGPLGKFVAIVRRDLRVSWTLYLDKRQYTEMRLAGGSQPGKPDLASFDLGNLKKENLGRENVLGYACTKMRVVMGNLPNGQPMVATVWMADTLEIPLRLETMGITQENRNLRPGPQPASLFEIPAGFTKINAPGMPAGMTAPSAAGAAPRYGGKTASATGATAQSAASSAAAMEMNTNRVGGDYREFELAKADPAACKASCDRESQCQAWTYVKPGGPGERAHCWLKETVPPANSEDCCVSGVKR